MMQVSRKVPFDDPNVLNMVRAGYLASNLIIMSIYVYISYLVDKKKGKNAATYCESRCTVPCACG